MSGQGSGLAFIFPGQGSQKVGMGARWVEPFPEARTAFEEADRVLGFPLSRLAWEGPEEELTLTANAQPALLATSVAIYRVVSRLGLPLVAVAGHSLGEYSALVAAGALAYEDALRLVRRRGELMQAAVPAGEGAMAAVLALDDAAVSEVAAAAAQGEVCTVANYNAPGQTVLAGHVGAIERAMDLARERGARKVVRLSVSAPFHSPLMRAAQEGMAELLTATEVRDPRVPVVVNVDARPRTHGVDLRAALIAQVASPVRWTESVRHLASELGVGRFVELGPGTVLTGLVRRIAEGSLTASVSEPEDLPKLLDKLGLESEDLPIPAP